MREDHVDVAVIGAGTAGLVAVREIRKKTDNVLLIQDGPYGTTCARVGCMPSKAFIQVALDYHRRLHMASQGIHGANTLSVHLPDVMQHVRTLRDRFTGGMIQKTDQLGERFLKGRARFLDPHTLQVDGRTIHARKTIIATGSRPVVPKAWQELGDRVWTSDTFFEQESLPSTVAVIGLGVIGLELGQAMARLGVHVIGIARSQHLAGITDPEVLDVAAAYIGRDLTMWRGHAADLTGKDGTLQVSAGPHTQQVDAVLAAVGRRPNVDAIGLDRLGVTLQSNGVPEYNPDTLQIANLPIFLAGDVNTAHPILHEAWDDGRIAGHNATHTEAADFTRRTPLHIVFTEPNIASAGLTYQEVSQKPHVIGEVRFEDQGRAVIKNEHAGILRVYAEAKSGRLLGTEMCAPAGEHMGHLLAWSIQQNLTVHDLLQMPFYHPTLEEGLRSALEMAAKKLND